MVSRGKCGRAEGLLGAVHAKTKDAGADTVKHHLAFDSAVGESGRSTALIHGNGASSGTGPAQDLPSSDYLSLLAERLGHAEHSVPSIGEDAALRRLTSDKTQKLAEEFNQRMQSLSDELNARKEERLAKAEKN